MQRSIAESVVDIDEPREEGEVRAAREETGPARCGEATAVKTVGRGLPEPGDRGPSVPADGAATPAPPSPRPRQEPIVVDDADDDGPVLLPPPPSWVLRIQELVQRHPGLAPLFAGEPEHALDLDGRLWLHPWRAEHDIGALLDWSALLEGPVSVRRGPGRGRTWDTVTIDGMLAGHPTRLVGHTHRLPTDRWVVVDLALLQAIAAREDEAADGSSPAQRPAGTSAWFDPVASTPALPAVG